MSVTISEQEFSRMGLPQQLSWAVQNLGNDTDMPPEHRAIFSSVKNLVDALTQRGAFSSETLASLLREVGVLSGQGEPAVHHATVTEIQQAPQIQQPNPPSEEPVNHLEELERFVSTLAVELRRDDKNRIRTVDGRYVCKACLREMREDVFIADAPRQLGPHMKAHEDKLPRWVDELDLPRFEEPVEVEIPEEVDTSHIEENPAQFQTGVSLYNQAAGEVAAQDELSQADIISLIDGKMRQIETNIAKLVLVLLSIPEANRKQLFESLEEEDVGYLVEVITR